MTADAGLPVLLDAIRHLEGCDATRGESVPVCMASRDDGTQHG
jgi:hypothetical protein